MWLVEFAASGPEGLIPTNWAFHGSLAAPSEAAGERHLPLSPARGHGAISDLCPPRSEAITGDDFHGASRLWHTIQYLMDWIGIFAFALSGALLAISKYRARYRHITMAMLALAFLAVLRHSAKRGHQSVDNH